MTRFRVEIPRSLGRGSVYMVSGALPSGGDGWVPVVTLPAGGSAVSWLVLDRPYPSPVQATAVGERLGPFVFEAMRRLTWLAPTVGAELRWRCPFCGGHAADHDGVGKTRCGPLQVLS